MTQHSAAQQVQMSDAAPHGNLLADEADGLRAWTTDQLFQEVLQRSAGDAPALGRMQEIILKALLAAV